jgi:predicted Zn-dependent peptidase
LAASGAITEFRLDNGLRVISVERCNVPAVTVHVTYGVGSRNDPPGRTGLAHLIEHLMFQGSAHVAAGEHAELLERIGSYRNAVTNFDETSYFETVPGQAFELAMWLEADRMGSLPDGLNQRNLDNQRDVVKNERWQRFDNQPFGVSHERLFGALFPEGHPYRNPPIGSLADLDAATLGDVTGFFRTHYVPGNAVLAIVGDVDHRAALAAARTYFDGIPGGRRAPGTARRKALPPLASQHRAQAEERVPAAALYAAWRLPADGTPECDAAAVAVRILAGGQDSRLGARLTRERSLCRTVAGSIDRLVEANSAALVIARARPDCTAAGLEDIEAAMDAELDRFAADGPDADEVARAVAQLESDILRDGSTYGGLAFRLARQACLSGKAVHGDAALSGLRQVSARQVRAVAAEWLLPGQRAQLTYPTPTLERAGR